MSDKKIKKNTLRRPASPENLDSAQGDKVKNDKKELKVNWEEKATENLAGWQRAQADYENLQKEFEKQKGEYVKYANGNLIMELLPIYDNFKMAFNAVPEDEKDSGWLVGLQHIMTQMWTFLENNGVTEIKTVGEKFDPELHEAVESVDEGKKEDVIIKEIKSGYKLNDKVIQCAKVVVNK